MICRSPLKALLLSALILPSAGCTLVPERSPLTHFDLPAQAQENAARGGPAVDATLRLSTPRASGLLDSRRILVVPQPNQPQVYEGARWSDEMPKLVLNRLFDAFQDDGRVARVVHADSTVSGEVELLSDLRTFQSEYRSGMPEAVVRLDVRLVETRSQQLIASHRFVQRHPAASEAIPDVVTAFGVATDSLARELVGWTVAELERP